MNVGVFLFVGVLSGLAIGWWFAVFVAVVVLVVAPFLSRRIELDGQGLTLVPFLPIRPCRRVAFSDVGSISVNHSGWYASAPYGVVRIARLSHRDINLAAMYGNSYGSRPLAADDLVSLIDHSRHAPKVL
jgi:hypothetical protein